MSLNLFEVRSPVTGELLHLYVKKIAMEPAFSRTDFVEPNQRLQAAVISIPANFEFRAHRHIDKSEVIPLRAAQESWVVVEGSVEVDYYDVDDSLIESVILSEGEISVTLKGGHNYRTNKESALVFEFKSGPYLGLERDKVFI